MFRKRLSKTQRGPTKAANFSKKKVFSDSNFKLCSYPE